MSEPVRVSRRRARQLAVMGQLLDAPRRTSIEDVVARLGQVQIDPTSVVARTEHLVLFSRLGPRFRVADLERLLWQERALFEYWVHIVPIRDLPLHRISMRRYPDSDLETTHVRPGVAGRQRRVRPVRVGRAPAPRPVARARPGEPSRRGVAGRRLERRGAERADAARHPVVPGQGHDRRARRAAADLGSGLAVAADGPDSAQGRDGGRAHRAAAAGARRHEARPVGVPVRRGDARSRARPSRPAPRRGDRARSRWRG